MKLIIVWIMLIMMLPTAFAKEVTKAHAYVFVSFSMPKDTLKEWIHEASLYHLPIVIRGLCRNSFKETINEISKFDLKVNEGFMLDPTLFKKFNIEKVPAVVVEKNQDCPANLTCMNDSDVIYGNTTLFYALKRIADSEDTVAIIAKEIIENKKEKSHA